MKIVCIGGGPASLYFSMLAKKNNPDWEIEVYEQNPANVTWGFGVVFSDETMEGFCGADEKTYQAIINSFVHWDDIDIFYKGTKTVSRGHGFAGMQRLRLLQILEERAREVGVVVRHDIRVTDNEQFPDADLIIAGDGVASAIRDKYEDEFVADVVFRPNKFVWLGSNKAFDTFTFYFNENEHGLWRAHCYQYMPGNSTFIIETTEDTWRRAGLEAVTEEQTVEYCAKVFEKELGNDVLITNNSLWRTFPRVKNAKYFHKNIVLLGDALHTAHFSIGSGTKLAMEDAVALNDILNNALADGKDLQGALQAFQEEREPVVDSLQRAAQVSMEWFENVERYHGVMEPAQFAFSLLTRSLRITHDNLNLRDADLVDEINEWVADTAEKQSGEPRVNPTPPPIFTPFRLRELLLENRIAVSPMCMYSADDGLIGDWHLVHLGSRAIGGAGLLMTEATAISPQGRITPGCAGLYKDEHIAAWKKVVDFIHANTSTKIGTQLCHAGRKASTKFPLQGGEQVSLGDGDWEIFAPSPIAYTDDTQTPQEMTREDMNQVRDDFVVATERAAACGFDILELHCAHGYLLSSFMSPQTNQREDEFGGSLENRLRFPLTVFSAIRDVWPGEKPMSVRISATDWSEGGFSAEDAVVAAKMFKAAGCDILDVSAGQVVAEQKPVYGRLFQTPFSDKVRLEADIPTMTVGNIQSYADANSIIAGGRADICVIARMHLFDPYWTRHAANDLGYDLDMPDQYKSVQDYTPRWN